MTKSFSPSPILTPVSLSGLPVFIQSGIVFANNSLSGQVVQISGQTIRATPVSTAGVSNAFVNTNSDSQLASSVGAVGASYAHGFDAFSGAWARLRVTNSTDGFKLIVSNSGQVSPDYGTSVVAIPMTVCTALSGGTTLATQACIEATVRSMSGNGVMFVAGVSGQAPFSGKGIELYGGESISRRITNFNQISILATTSGQLVSTIGVL